MSHSNSPYRGRPTQTSESPRTLYSKHMRASRRERESKRQAASGGSRKPRRVQRKQGARGERTNQLAAQGRQSHTAKNESTSTACGKRRRHSRKPHGRDAAKIPQDNKQDGQKKGKPNAWIFRANARGAVMLTYLARRYCCTCCPPMQSVLVFSPQLLFLTFRPPCLRVLLCARECNMRSSETA